MEPISKILLCGGTHGNELTGVRLVEQWMKDPAPIQRTGLDVRLLLANPEAIQLCRRYVGFDLNRAFTPQLLDPQTPAAYPDIVRAREINREFGPKGTREACDLAIDLHNSTANMGITLILNRLDPLIRRVCAILANEFPLVRILYQPEPLDQLAYLPSLAKRDITIEVGPQAHGTLRASLYSQTRRVVLRLLDLITEWNNGSLPLELIPVPVFTQIGNLDYPRDEQGEVYAMIHPEREGRDFEPVYPSDPLFQSFAGERIPWQGPGTLWPCFVGEAAYLEKHIALTQMTLNVENW